MTMQVWALRNADGSFRGKFHRYDSYDCKGRRMYEENYADRGDYVLVDLRDLPGRQGACQFECCFQGLNDATAVVGQYAESRVAERPGSLTPSPAVAPRDLDRTEGCVPGARLRRDKIQDDRAKGRRARDRRSFVRFAARKRTHRPRGWGHRPYRIAARSDRSPSSCR
jgi:hypothetical protein